MSDSVDDPQFFADGARWNIAVAIVVLAILAGALFGWRGVAAVLAVPVGLLVMAAATLAFIVVVLWSVVETIDEEVENIGDDELEE